MMAVKMAAPLGHIDIETDPNEALCGVAHRCVLRGQAFSRCYLHLSGKPKFIASVMPTYIMGAKAACASVHRGQALGILATPRWTADEKADHGASGRSWIACPWATHRGSRAKTPFRN